MAATGPRTRFQSCTERPFQVRDRLGWHAEAPPPRRPRPRTRSQAQHRSRFRRTTPTSTNPVVPGEWCLLTGALCLVPGALCLVPCASWYLVPCLVDARKTDLGNKRGGGRKGEGEGRGRRGEGGGEGEETLFRNAFATFDVCSLPLTKCFVTKCKA